MLKNKLTPADLDAMVASATFHQPAGSTLTVCVLVLTNGCTLVGTSNVIDPANYDAELGQVVALSNAKGKIWEAEGYALKRDAQVLVIKAARTAHEVNRAWCEANGDDSQPAWDDAPEWQKDSAVLGVRAILNNPDTTPELSHAYWGAHKLADGWIYGEVKDPVKKTHPCLVPYDRLPEVHRIKDSLFIAAVKAVLS